MADGVPAGAWSESASSMVTWGLLLTGLGWGGRQPGALGAPGAQRCLPAPTSAQGASWSPVVRWQASFCSPLALFNPPASPCCSPRCLQPPAYVTLPVTSPSPPSLGPGRAAPALCSGVFVPEGELVPTPSSPQRGACGAVHGLSAPASLPEPVLHCGTTVTAAVSRPCCAGVSRPRGCLSLISDCVIRECLIFLLALC